MKHELNQDLLHILILYLLSSFSLQLVLHLRHHCAGGFNRRGAQRARVFVVL